MSDHAEPAPVSAHGREFPCFEQLPLHHGVPTAWDYTQGLESLGRLVHQTPGRIVAAASRLIRSGRTFRLDIDPSFVDPPLFGRRAARHTVLTLEGGEVLDDVIDDYFPQAASQWDALGHTALTTDTFYGGATQSDVLSGRRDTLDAWARRRIAGRAVLLDLDAAWGRAGTGFDPTEPRPITVADLEGCRSGRARLRSR